MKVHDDATVNPDKRRTYAISHDNPETRTKHATTTSQHHVTPIGEQDAGMEVAETRPVWNDTDTDPTPFQDPEMIPFTTATARTFPSSSTDSSFTVIQRILTRTFATATEPDPRR